MAYKDIFKRKWQILSDDQDGQQDPNDPNADPTTNMQTLTDGTAQQLCQRLWQGYVTDNMATFPEFMAQIDGIVTQYVQSLPTPPDPSSLEDVEYDKDGNNVPSIGPATDEE